MPTIDDLSAEHFGRYAAVCPLYPGDVVSFFPSVSMMDPEREWVVAAYQHNPLPIGGTFGVNLMGLDEAGEPEPLSIASRSMLKLIRRAGA